MGVTALSVLAAVALSNPILWVMRGLMHLGELFLASTIGRFFAGSVVFGTGYGAFSWLLNQVIVSKEPPIDLLGVRPNIRSPLTVNDDIVPEDDDDNEVLFNQQKDKAAVVDPMLSPGEKPPILPQFTDAQNGRKSPTSEGDGDLSCSNLPQSSSLSVHSSQK